MDTYALMKENGAGTVAPGHFHPSFNPAYAEFHNPAGLASPFKSGLLPNVAGSDSAHIASAGAIAFLHPDLNGPRYVQTGTGASDLADYDTWLAANVTDDNILKLFEQAWLLYPYGFYWVPAIHPTCHLYEPGSPKTLSFVRKNGKLYAPLLLQRYAHAAYLSEALTFGLRITGSIETSLGYGGGVMDVILFTLNTQYSITSGGFFFSGFPSFWYENQLGTITNSVTGETDTAALAGTFTLNEKSAYTDPALGKTVTYGYIAMTTSDIATLRTEIWPAGGGTSLIASTSITEEDIREQLVSAHGLSEAQAAGLFPVPSETTGTYFPGLYTGTTNGVTRNMIVWGVGNNRDYGTGIELDFVTSPANPRIVEEADLTSFSFLFDSSKQAHWTSRGGSGSSGVVYTDTAVLTSPAKPGTAVANLTSVDASARRVIYANVTAQMLTGLNVTLVLTTGTATYFTDSAKIGIRVEGIDYFNLETLPDGIEYYDYDSNESILWLAIDGEALGLETTTDNNGSKTFKPLQSLTVSFNIPGGTSSGISDVLRLMTTTGSFVAGGSYEDGGTTEVPAFLSSWNSFTPIDELVQKE